MRYFNKLLKLLLITTLILSSAHVASAFQDAIIARVNNELITLKDLKDYINAIYTRLTSEGIPETEIKKLIAELQETGLSKLIEDKLILSEANNIGIEINEKPVNARIDALKKQYPSNDYSKISLNPCRCPGPALPIWSFIGSCRYAQIYCRLFSRLYLAKT